MLHGCRGGRGAAEKTYTESVTRGCVGLVEKASEERDGVGSAGANYADAIAGADVFAVERRVRVLVA